MFLNATVGCGGILTAGIIPPVIKKISAHLVTDERNNINATIRGGLSLSVTGGALASLLLLIIFVCLGESLLGKIGSRETLLLIGITAAVVLWIDQLDAVFIATLRGAERFDLSGKVEVIARTLIYLVAGIAVTIGSGINGIFIAQIGAALFRLIFRFYYARQILPEVCFKPDFRCAKEILGLARWGWIQGAGNAFYSIADRFILGAAMGAASLAHYTVASQLAIQIQAVMGAVLSVLFPVISRSIAIGRTSEIARITTMTLAGSWSFVSAACFVLIYWRTEILTLWVGRDMALASQQILFYLAIASWVQGATVAPHFILQGFGKFKLVAITGLVGGIASTIIMLLLVSGYGESGVGIGRIAYGAAMCFYFFPLMKLVYVKDRAKRPLSAGAA